MRDFLTFALPYVGSPFLWGACADDWGYAPVSFGKTLSEALLNFECDELDRRQLAIECTWEPA